MHLIAPLLFMFCFLFVCFKVCLCSPRLGIQEIIRIKGSVRIPIDHSRCMRSLLNTSGSFYSMFHLVLLTHFSKCMHSVQQRKWGRVFSIRLNYYCWIDRYWRYQSIYTRLELKQPWGFRGDWVGMLFPNGKFTGCCAFIISKLYLNLLYLFVYF